MKHVLASLLMLLPVGMAPAFAEDQLPPGFDPQRHMRVSEVKDGMKGYGLSVFRGTKIERFDVEVLSILRNFNPKDDVVLVRLKGANLEHTGAIAGMSGSPVFLKDDQGRERMIGAFAYGWPLMKDPVGGVQPIEYMLRLSAAASKGQSTAQAQTPESKSGDVATPARHQMRWSIAEVMPLPGAQEAPAHYPLAAWNSPRPNPSLVSGSDATRLRPLSTPLMVSGLPQNLFNEFQPVLASYGIVALQAGGAGAAPSAAPGKIEPGSAMAVPMMTGDVELTAIGTCTEVVGDRVLGFGHSFFSEGEVALPMSAGYIHSVIANLSNSFKLGAAAGVLGTLQSDQVYGIAGRFGPAPRTVPIELRCVYADGSLDQTYRFNAAIHPRFTPMLASMALSAATTSTRELPQYNTVDYDLNLEFENGQNLRIENRYANSNIAELFFMVGGPIMSAAENPFERVTLKKMTGTVRISKDARLAEILSVSVPKTKYRPGETVKAFLRYRPFRQPEMFLPLEFELPRNLPDGPYEFSVADWQQHMASEQASKPFRFTAESASEVFDVLRDVTSLKRNALYLRLMRQPDGVAIGRTAMPRLPSSRRRIILGGGLSNTTPFVSSTVKTVSTDYVMSGAASFTLTIDKDAKVESPKSARTPGNVPSGAQRLEKGEIRPPVKAEPDAGTKVNDDDGK